MKQGKIVLFQSKRNRQFYFRCVAPNGKVLDQSEGYTTRGKRDKGLQSLRKLLSQASVIIHDEG